MTCATCQQPLGETRAAARYCERCAETRLASFMAKTAVTVPPPPSGARRVRVALVEEKAR